MQFTPEAAQDFPVQFVVTYDAGDSIEQQIQLDFFGAGFSLTGETNCQDGVDDDGDLLIDCDDPDCGGVPACNSSDFCCFVGNPNTFEICQDGGAKSCVCALDSLCCIHNSGVWDQICSDFYVQECAATTCGG